MKNSKQIKNSGQPHRPPENAESGRFKVFAPELGIINNLYESVIHKALDAFFITDVKGKILEVNDAMCRMEGYTREELLSMSLMDLDIDYINKPHIFMENQERFIKTYHESGGKTDSIYIEKRHKRKDGRIIDIEISYHYLGPELNLFFHFNRDITERKQYEDRLRESKEFVESIIASMRDGFCIIDTDGVNIAVNDSLCKMTGFNREELIGQCLPYPYWPEEAYSSLRKSINKTLKGEVKDHEVVFRTKKGKRFQAIVSPSCLKDKEGRIINIFSIIKDVTEYKKYRQEQNLRRQAEERLRQRAEFTRALAHDLKTPLTPLLATSEILMAENPPEPLARYAHNINAGARDMNERLDNLLDLARGEVGLIKLDLKRTDIPSLLHDVNDYIKPGVLKSGLNLELNISSSIPKVLADKKRLRQVVLNLLDNAIKFTERGGGITIKVWREDGFVITRVTDTGCGVNEANKDVIFQPYTNLHRRKTNCDGLGLGLSMSKMIIELHGGKIWLDSKYKQGAAFCFSLPIYGHKKTKTV